MNNLGKQILHVILITAFILAALFLVGCGDSEMTKEITGAFKKSVEGEVAKKGGEIKKQFDQIINVGNGKEQKEDGKGDAGGADKEKAEKDSGEGSAEEND